MRDSRLSHLGENKEGEVKMSEKERKMIEELNEEIHELNIVSNNMMESYLSIV